MSTKLNLPLQKQAIDDEVHKWFDQLAKGDYKAAFDMTLHDPYYQWTPELMESVIYGYGLPYEEGETKYFVTNWRTASGKDRDVELDLYEKHVEGGGYVQLGHTYCKIPLNGEGSDLSVVFLIVRYEDGAALLLEEIHVL